MKKKFIISLGCIIGSLISINSYSQSIYDNNYDANSRNGITENSNNRIYLLSSKKMTPYDISFYTGMNTNAGHVDGDKWVVDIAHGYGQFGSPFYMQQSNKNYSLIIEYEIAANFDTKYQAPYAYIDVFNHSNVIEQYPITKNLGYINGNDIRYEKIKLRIDNIPSAYNLQPRFRTYLQDNKKIYIKSISYFLTKPVN